ncbi:MAG: DUF2232 domain-containing protein [candidate division Zixibacteria bacterium]|nr:DUF2232 domain-containing protein [candidate division Zixibacteria bacterium]
MNSIPTEAGVNRHQIKPELTSFAVAIIAVNSALVGIPVVNYVLGILGVACYPYLFVTERKNLAMVLAVGTLIIASIVSGLTGMFSLLLSVTLPGIAIGWAMKSDRTAGEAIILGFLPAFVIMLFFLINRAELEAVLVLAIDEGIAQMTTLPGFLEDTESMQESLHSFGKTIFMIMPSLILLSGLFNSFIGYLIASKILRKRDYEVPTIPHFTRWKPNYNLVWLFIAGLFISVIGVEGTKAVGWNILVFTGIIYFVIGLAVVENFFMKAKMPVFFKILFYIGILFAQLFSLVVLAGVGLFDSWFNFRNRGSATTV